MSASVSVSESVSASVRVSVSCVSLGEAESGQSVRGKMVYGNKGFL